MKTWIAGRDESSFLHGHLRDVAAHQQGSASLSGTHPSFSALRLRECANESEFFQRYLNILSHRHILSLPAPQVRKTRNPVRWVISRTKALIQRKFLMFQHDHIAYNQTQFNRLALYATQFDGDTTQREIQTMKARLGELEEKLRRAAL